MIKEVESFRETRRRAVSQNGNDVTQKINSFYQT